MFSRTCRIRARFGVHYGILFGTPAFYFVFDLEVDGSVAPSLSMYHNRPTIAHVDWLCTWHVATSSGVHFLLAAVNRAANPAKGAFASAIRAAPTTIPCTTYKAATMTLLGRTAGLAT